MGRWLFPRSFMTVHGRNCVPESKGAFGRPDVKVYTPTSEGSHGTVLLSAKKQMRLGSGTRLLLVVQPPPNGDLDPAQFDLNDLSPNP